MKQIQFHKEAGIRIQDAQSKAVEYLQDKSQSMADAELNEADMPADDIVRIFELKDGRTAVVRETEAGLVQEAATGQAKAFLASLKGKTQALIAKQLEHEANEAIEVDLTVDIPEE